MPEADKVPVRYVGNATFWRDHLYGSKMVFKRGRVTQTPPWAASRLLRHPEFEDARPVESRGQVIVAERPRELTEEQEIEMVDQTVRLDTMTKDQMAHFALRAFGVRLDPTDLKVDVTAKVRSLMQIRGAR